MNSSASPAKSLKEDSKLPSPADSPKHYPASPSSAGKSTSTFDGDDFHVDLLFFHIEQSHYVVIELKTRKFQPEYAGKFNFYVALVTTSSGVSTTAKPSESSSAAPGMTGASGTALADRRRL